MSLYMMNRFERLINYSPLKIVPDGGAHVRVVQMEHGKNFANCSIAPFTGEGNKPEGTVTLQTPATLWGIIPFQRKKTIEGGVVTVPDGGTAEISGSEWSARIEVHKNDTPPMVQKAGEKTFHHVASWYQETADPLPGPAKPEAGIWWEKDR